MRRTLLLLSLAAACSGEEAPVVEDRLPDLAGLRLERTFATVGSDGPVLGGFDGSAEPGTVVKVAGTETTADADGRFSLPLPPGEIVEVTLGDHTVAYRVRQPDAARVAAVLGPIGGTGDTPNDLVIAGDPARAVIVRTADNAVSEFDLESGLRDDRPGVRLPRVGDDVASPWFVTAFDDLYAVTAHQQDLVYIVDLEAGEIRHTLEIGTTLPLAEPFVLPRPMPGTGETRITAVAPTAPQPVVVHDGRMYVAFSGFVDARQDVEPIYVPAVLAVWRTDDFSAAPSLHLLPTMNPQELRVREDGRVAIVSTGVFDLQNGTLEVLSDGAVDVFDPTTETFTERFELGRFAPTTALFVRDRLWVASLANAMVRSISRDDPTDFIELNLTGSNELDSVFRLVELDGGLIAAPTFNRDELHVIDTRTNEIDAAPFFAPLLVGAGPPVYDGLQIVARRSGRRGVDFTGPDLFALSGLAARITAVELRKILGP